MKTRITILAENDRPLSAIGDNPEEKVKKAWEWMIQTLIVFGENPNNDRYAIEKVEVSD